MRTTDFIGWYAIAKLGMLFTEIDMANCESIAQLLRSRIVGRIPEHFPVWICSDVSLVTPTIGAAGYVVKSEGQQLLKAIEIVLREGHYEGSTVTYA